MKLCSENQQCVVVLVTKLIISEILKITDPQNFSALTEIRLTYCTSKIGFTRGQVNGIIMSQMCDTQMKMGWIRAPKPAPASYRTA